MAQNKRTRRKARIAKAGAAAAVILLAILFILLFRVRKIQVYGNDHHSSEEISAEMIDDAFMKNTVYLLWKYRDGKVPSGMPYLESLHVQMKSPSRVDVHVKEKMPVAYFDKGSYIYIDQDGTVLEITDQTYEGIPIVTGVAMEEPLLYQKLPVQSSAQLRTILSLTQLLSYQNVAVDEIRFGENMEITVYTGNIETQLGQDEYLEEKIANLAKILPRLDGQRGTLHLEGFTGRNEQVPFTPSHEEADFSEGEGDVANPEGASDSGEGGQAGEGGQDADGEGSGDGQAAGDGADDADGQGDGDGEADEDKQEDVGTVYPMVFNSSGTLVYNVHVENGTVVDEYGNPVPGVTVNENGNVVDAYMNEYDSTSGEWIQP